MYDLNLTLKKFKTILGFLAFLNLGFIANTQTIPPCGSSQPAGNTCAEAVLICNVNGYCGSTSSSYGANYWSQLNSAFCGSIENNSFLQFVAGSSTVSLNIWVTSSSSGSGIQAFIFSANNCSGAVTSYVCDNQISPNSGVNVVTATGLTPGNTYYLMIDGFAGDVCNYTIGAGSGVQIGGSITAPATNVCLGSTVTLTANGGNGIYNWTPNPNLTVVTSSTAAVLPISVGTHTYSMTSYSNNPFCPASSVSSITLTVVAPPAPNAGIDDTVCLGSPILLHGQVASIANSALWQFITTGITPTPTVAFSPNFSNLNPTVSVNQPGLYKFVLRESNTACGLVRDTVQVLVSSTNHTVAALPPSCQGLSDATISINNPDAVSYSYDNGLNWLPNSSMNNFTPGTYQVCSKNALGCQKCSSVSVPDAPPISIIVTNDTIVCENGTATLGAAVVVLNTPGVNNFNFHWNHTSSLLPIQLVSPTTPGYYAVYATNSNGCTSPSDSIYVNILPPLNGNISSAQHVCPGFGTSLSANAFGGNNGPYNFTWSSGSSQTGINSSISDAPSTSTNYTVTITDGCESTPLVLNSSIIVDPLPVPLISTTSSSGCEPNSFVLTNVSDPSMTAGLIWNISDGEQFINMDQIQTVDLWAGSYDVQLIITSPDGCIDSMTWNQFLTVHPKPEADFRYSPNPIQMFNTQAIFTNYSSNADTYQWFFESANPGYSNQFNPVVMFPDGVAAQYNVTLIAESNLGCADTMTQILTVYPEVLIYAPNTFTPDNDEYNQDWGVFMEGIDPFDFKLTIYNRWGEIVWESLDPKGRWDGTYFGEKVKEGTYIWTIQTKDLLNDNKYSFNGFVNILK